MNPDNVEIAAASCACANTRKLARGITRYYNACLEPAGLSIVQFGILARIAARPGLLMGELAAMLGINKTTLSRTLPQLKKRGWIVVETSKQDRREIPLRLSSAGQEKLRQALPHWQKAQAAFENDIMQKALDHLENTLNAYP